MPPRDYSDSDDDEGPAAGPSSASLPPPKSSGPRVKLTFRPTLTHLINDDPSAVVSDSPPPSQPLVSQSERSSLSPPPPLTLKLGRPIQSRIAEKANYSDSSDEEDDTAVQSTSATQPAAAKRPAKKSKKVHPPPPSAPPAPASASGEVAGTTKKYDWLAPSVVGASHHGPPERSGAVSPTVSQSGGAGGSVSSKDGASEASRRLSGWAPGEDYVAQVAVETTSVKKPSKSSKGSGLGKAWRKGIKKGMPMPTREDIIGANASHTPGDATPQTDGSPEPQEPPAPAPRAPSPPFVKADPAVLGFPVFSKPIAPPKFNLSTFPKVSPVFAPINGGDVGPFPRKERVRCWKFAERSIMGIAGSPLKFKTWTKDGPPSELSRLVQADKEAKEASLKKSKLATGVAPERPVFSTAASSESVPTTSSNPAVSLALGGEADIKLAGNGNGSVAADDGISEIGDGEESVMSFKDRDDAASSRATPPPAVVPAQRKVVKGPKAKAGPRKSKLAQEIKAVSEVGSASDAIEDIM